MHSRYYGLPLASEFRLLVKSLEEMSRFWIGHSQTGVHSKSIFSQLALRLRTLNSMLENEPGCRISMYEPSEELQCSDSLSSTSPRADRISQQGNPPGSRNDSTRHHPTFLVSADNISAIERLSKPSWTQQSFRPSTGTRKPATPQHVSELHANLTDAESDELTAISQMLMDERFTEMDRIVSFDDMMLTSRPLDMAAVYPDRTSGLDESGNIPLNGIGNTTYPFH